MELTWYRTLVIALALVVTIAGLWSRWRSGDVVDTHQARALELCPARLAAQGLVVRDLASQGSAADPDYLRADMAKRWDWGRFEFQSSLFADRLAHPDSVFEAVRASLYLPLADGGDGESRCRLAVCIYSIPLDAAIASVRDGRCGGSGAHRLVTPSLKPDILNQPYR